ncbi:DoxX family protein [Bradyrhizobium cenepequi]|uniref:DoxX family protein n=1 Tax=Bradyrhizobium cenepequi TaxID=2821403 RepID=UPI001CE2E16C|nr:DoxX family protein [Bradyrhizobium cenepequi]MCA6107349.1 DoxX family protein [Bradyrhizobium cenepequi]
MPGFIAFGRVLFAVLFIYSGASKLLAIQATADSFAAKVTIPEFAVSYAQQLESMAGMPIMQLIAISVGAFEIIAGLMIALNWLVRFFSILLIILVIGATYYFHDFWNQPAPDNAHTLMEALKNLSIIGALFILAGYGRTPRNAEAAYGDV